MSETKDAWLKRVLGVAVPGAMPNGLEGRLAAALKRVAPLVAAEPGRRDELVGLATAARNAVGAGAADSAVSLIAALEAALAPGAAAAPPARPNFVDYAKARLAWDGAVKVLNADLDALRDEILTEFADAPAFAEVSGKMALLTAVAESFREGLSERLDQALNATDAALRSQHHAEAARLVDRFLTYAEGDAFLLGLDDNPFVDFTGRRVVVTALKTLNSLLA